MLFLNLLIHPSIRPSTLSLNFVYLLLLIVWDKIIYHIVFTKCYDWGLSSYEIKDDKSKYNLRLNLVVNDWLFRELVSLNWPKHFTASWIGHFLCGAWLKIFGLVHPNVGLFGPWSLGPKIMSVHAHIGPYLHNGKNFKNSLRAFYLVFTLEYHWIHVLFSIC